MGFFPQLSNVYPELQTLLDTRIKNTNKPWLEGGVSGLSTWIRIISGVDKGLIFESVHHPDSFNKRYGNSDKPGILGYELDNKTPVEIDGSGRGLRPSPIVKQLTVDESAEGGTRTCKFNIVCYTKEQTDKLAQYFLEPSFHVLVEFGWNVPISWEQRCGGGETITDCMIAEYDEWLTVKTKRIKSNFQYDAMLGIVSGGGISFSDGETYELSVELTGIGNVAEYMQTHRGANRTDKSNNGSGLSFKPKTITADAQDGNVGVALFKQAFNGLPSAKRTDRTKSWFEKNDNGTKWSYEGNFVNFDESVKDYLLKWLTKGKKIATSGSEPLKIPTDAPLFDEERFIRFELACAILQSFPIDLKPTPTKCRKKSRNLTINIKNTPIGGFPHMFSTDKTKLFIPNTTSPNFNLKQILVASDDASDIEYIKYNDLNNKDNLANLHPLVNELPPNDSRASANGSAYDPSVGKSRLVPFAFPCEYKLDGSVLSYECDETVLPRIAEPKFWGWLKDLYINFDFFVDCLSKPNLVVRDVLYDMLNGMSGACNSLWRFQIFEKPTSFLENGKPDPNGSYELVVEDLNFKGDVDPFNRGMAIFQARGTKSPFINCDFSVQAEGAMMSSVVQKKMASGKLDGSNEGIRPMFGKVFSTDKNDSVGAILLNIKQLRSDETEEPDKEIKGEDVEEKEEDAKAKAFELFTQRAGVYSKIQDREGKIDITKAWWDIKKSNNGIIEDLLMVGAWNDPSALKQIELIDKGLVKGAPASQSKSKAQKQNPPLGLADFSFDVHGVSGFKVGDQFRVTGLPDKFGEPNFYQVVKVDQAMDNMTWITNVKGTMMLIGEESDDE